MRVQYLKKSLSEWAEKKTEDRGRREVQAGWQKDGNARLNRVRAMGRKERVQAGQIQLAAEMESKKRNKERSKETSERERERQRGGAKKEEIDSLVPPPVPPVRALSAACFMSSWQLVSTFCSRESL